MANPPEDWVIPDWPAPARVRALITSRNGGCSSGPYESMNLGLRVNDNSESVQANRRLLRQFLPAEPKWLHQVHGTRVVDAKSVMLDEPADAAVATQPGCVCAVMVADCLPVLFAQRGTLTVAAAHAGWRGLAGGVLENTIRAFNTSPGNLIAYLGPAIGPTAFEVGHDVRDAFVAADPDAKRAFHPHKPDKWLADLYLLARQRLATAGLLNVYGVESCTYSNPARYFSHRRDKVSGRMAALIWIEN